MNATITLPCGHLERRITGTWRCIAPAGHRAGHALRNTSRWTLDGHPKRSHR